MFPKLSKEMQDFIEGNGEVRGNIMELDDDEIIERITGEAPTDETRECFNKFTSLYYFLDILSNVYIDTHNKKLENFVGEVFKDILPEEIVPSTTDMIFNPNATVDGSLDFVANYITLNQQQVCILKDPMELCTLLHEVNHLLSSKISAETMMKGYAGKNGFNIQHGNSSFGSSFNELFTQYLAEDILSTLSEEEKREFIVRDASAPNIYYRNYFPLIKPFFDENKEILTRAYLGFGFDELFKKFDQEKFTNMMLDIDELYEFDAKSGKKIRRAMRCYQGQDDVKENDEVMLEYQRRIKIIADELKDLSSKKDASTFAEKEK